MNDEASRKPDINADVLIVGAGPTGLTLANLLGRMGVSVIVLERNEGTVAEPRAVSIDDESMRAMQAAGLAEKVQAITAQGYGSIYRGPDGRPFARVMPKSMEYGFNKRNAFEQPALEALLRKELGRFENVSAKFQTEMTGFTQYDDHVVATAREQTGNELTISARYLVGTDGGRSGVRKDLGIEMIGGTFEEPWLIVDLEATLNPNRHTEVFCDPARSCISLPGPNGIRRYEFMLNSNEDPEAATSEPFVRDLLDGVGPDRDAKLRRVQVYTFHARLAEHWRRDRVFLAGDAAHLTPPFAGQGMNSGLRDAHNLAWKLSEALKSSSPDALLDSYQIERAPHAQSMIDLALQMGRVMMPTSKIQGFLVRGAFRALGVYPPARDYFAQMKYKPKPRFSKGLIWPDQAGPANSVVGRMIPQPKVETPTRERFLLDELLPDQPVILLFSKRPQDALSDTLLQELTSAGAHIVGLTPEGVNPAAADIPIIRDVSCHFSDRPFNACLEQAILLRRDRYIAAIRPFNEVEQLVPFLRQIRFDQTDTGGNSNIAPKIDSNVEVG